MIPKHTNFCIILTQKQDNYCIVLMATFANFCIVLMATFANFCIVLMANGQSNNKKGSPDRSRPAEYDCSNFHLIRHMVLLTRFGDF